MGGVFRCVRCGNYGPHIQKGPDARMGCEPCREALIEAEKAEARHGEMTRPRPGLCGYCGEIYIATKSWQAYCSPRCRVRAHRAAKRVVA
jgi:hypothetical protein